MRRVALSWICIASVLLTAVAEDYVQSVDAWHQKRIESLTSPEGWLSLVGLVWLHPGANTFPSPPGTYWLEDGKVRVRAEGVLRDGQPFDEVTLDPKEPEGQTKLSQGTLTWYLIERNGQLGMRVKDSASPIRTGFKGIERYPVDPAWRIPARFEAAPRTIDVPNVLGVDTHEKSPGRLVFQHDGQTFELEPVLEEGEERFFVIFADASNGQGTYEAGRFLYVDPPVDGQVVLDFNRAYNPPCAFTHFATCPRPPEANHLPFAVTAGEKKY